MEREIEDHKLRVTMLEAQLADVRRRSGTSTSRDSYSRDGLSPEAAAVALGRFGSESSSAQQRKGNTPPPPPTALPFPPPAIPLPPLPGAAGHSPHVANNSLDTRTVSPTGSSRPQSPMTSLQAQQGQDDGVHQMLEEQGTRIRTVEKHLFAEKQLTATLEEALVDLETAQNKTRSEMEVWRNRCTSLEDELIGLRKQRSDSRASLQAVEEEREMRMRAERARMQLEERMRELNNSRKKKKNALNCF